MNAAIGFAPSIRLNVLPCPKKTPSGGTNQRRADESGRFMAEDRTEQGSKQGGTDESWQTPEGTKAIAHAQTVMLAFLRGKYPRRSSEHEDWVSTALAHLIRKPLPCADAMRNLAKRAASTVARDAIRSSTRQIMIQRLHSGDIARRTMGSAEVAATTPALALAALKRRTYEQLLKEFEELRGVAWNPRLAPRFDDQAENAQLEALELERRSIKALNDLREAVRELKSIHDLVRYERDEPNEGVATNGIVCRYFPAVARDATLAGLMHGPQLEASDLRINEALMAESRQRFAYAYIRDRRIGKLFEEVASGEREQPEINLFLRIENFVYDAPEVEVSARELAVAWLLTSAPIHPEGEPLDGEAPWSTWPGWNTEPNWSRLTPANVIKQAVDGFRKAGVGAKAIADAAMKTLGSSEEPTGEKKT